MNPNQEFIIYKVIVTEHLGKTRDYVSAVTYLSNALLNIVVLSECPDLRFLIYFVARKPTPLFLQYVMS